MNPPQKGCTPKSRSIDGIRSASQPLSTSTRPLNPQPRKLRPPTARNYMNAITPPTSPQAAAPIRTQATIDATTIGISQQYDNARRPSAQLEAQNNLKQSLNLDLPPIGTRRVIHKPKSPTLSARLPRSIYFSGVMSCFVAVVIGGATMLNAFIFQSYYVEGLSMQPTLQDDDRLIVSKVERTAAGVTGGSYLPKRGQIVVIDSGVSDLTKSRNEQIIKRVVGLPGDTVEIFEGKVIITNKEHPEGFNIDKLLGLEVSPTFVKGALQVYVPEDKVFVLGDNRTEGGSFDSRSFGPLDTDLIKGRLAVRVLPFSGVSVF